MEAIKSTDLRIGNKITTAHYEDFKTIIEVESLDEVGINLTAETDNKPYGMHNPLMEREYKYDELFSIPLTEEILLKCGFKSKDDKNEYYIVIDKPSKSNGLFICYDIKDKSCSLGQLRHFSHQFGEYHYLHQLQNLYFALTQTQLTINL